MLQSNSTAVGAGSHARGDRVRPLETAAMVEEAGSAWQAEIQNRLVLGQVNLPRVLNADIRVLCSELVLDQVNLPRVLNDVGS